jgi:hypothetical protein
MRFRRWRSFIELVARGIINNATVEQLVREVPLISEAQHGPFFEMANVIISTAGCPSDWKTGD